MRQSDAVKISLWQSQPDRLHQMAALNERVFFLARDLVTVMATSVFVVTAETTCFGRVLLLNP